MIRNSPFVQELVHAKRVTRGWAAYLVFLGCVFVVQGLAANQLPTIWPVETGSPASQLQEAAGNLLSILVLFLWVLLYERRSLFTMGFRRPSRGMVNLLLGIVGGAALVSVPILFLWATGNYVQAEAPASGSHGWSALPLVIALAAMFVLQGGNEEILMRGFLLQNQGWKVPGWLAVLLPAVIFTVLHGVLDKPIAFTMIMGFALFASFVVLRNNSLWWIIGIHAGWNWALANVYAISVSGLPVRTTALVYLEPAPGSPDWLTGGTFGTEGGLAAALTITAAAVIAFVLFRQRAKTWPPVENPTQEPAPAPVE